ncbi:MAG: HD domain-containing protein [Crenarchaeota archaeon]|nr:HD domain-containing protein [Thermoproteota archaeon]
MSIITPLDELFYDLLSDYEYKFEKKIDVSLQALPSKFEYIIPVYRRIEIENSIIYLLILPLFQRLVNIKQLAHTYTYLLGATHSRFEHSLGVAHLMKKVLKVLKKKLKSKGIEISRLGETIAVLSALLHDLGHSGWGHALDGIVGQVIDRGLEVIGRTLFAKIEKLDIAITVYLLHENYQLRYAICNIVRKFNENFDINEVIDQIAAIIEEEWYPRYTHIRNNPSILRFVRLIMLVLGAPHGIDGGLNIDRVDWLQRDLHHTEALSLISESNEIKCKELERCLEILRRITNNEDMLEKYIDILFNDDIIVRWKTSNKDIEVDINKCLNQIRSILYSTVYEGLERSFIDSTLIRLAYSAIEILYRVGNKIASPPIVARVLLSYLLQPDDKLRDYTQKILSLMAWISPDLYNIREPLKSFIERSVRLLPILDNLSMIVHKLKCNHLSTNNPFVLNIEIPGIEGYIALRALYCSFLKDVLKNVKDKKDKDVLKNMEIEHFYHSLIYNSRINVIDSLRIPDIEYLFNKELEKERSYSRYVRYVYFLPNYYAFRRLDEGFLKEKPITLEDLKNVFDNVKVPLMFILMQSSPKLQENDIKKLSDKAVNFLRTNIENLLQEYCNLY